MVSLIFEDMDSYRYLSFLRGELKIEILTIESKVNNNLEYESTTLLSKYESAKGALIDHVVKDIVKIFALNAISKVSDKLVIVDLEEQGASYVHLLLESKNIAIEVKCFLSLNRIVIYINKIDSSWLTKELIDQFAVSSRSKGKLYCELRKLLNFVH